MNNEDEALHQFMQECQEELVNGLSQERIGELLEWLKTREVLNAVECEMIKSAGPTYYQSESLLKILLARDTREHWIPLWNGIAKHAPPLHAKIYPTIGAKLGENALAGLTVPKAQPSVASRTHSFKKHSSSGRSHSVAGPPGADQVSPTPNNVGPHSVGATSSTAIGASAANLPTEQGNADLLQQIEQLTQERNAARAERKEALAEVEATTARRYQLEEQITAMKYGSEPLKSELRLLRDQLAKTIVDRDEAIQQKDLYRDQGRAATEENQAVHKMLSGLQRSHQETREQMKKQMDFYETELDRGRSRLQDFGVQEAMLLQAQQDIIRQKEMLAQLRHELDRSIPYEVKDGRLQIRSRLLSSTGDSGVHERGGSSDLSHSGVCVYPCEMEITLNVQDVEPGITFDTGVFVHGLAPGYSAAMDGRVAVGDRLIEINGVSTSNLTTIGEMVRGCRRKLNLVVQRYMLVPKLYLSNLPPLPSSTVIPFRTPVSYPSPVGASIGGAVSQDGYPVDRSSLAGSGSVGQQSLCSHNSGLSVKSFHSMHDNGFRGNHSLPNYYHASHLHPANNHPANHQASAGDRQFAFLTGPVVAAMANKQRSFSPARMPAGVATQPMPGGSPNDAHTRTANHPLQPYQSLTTVPGTTSHQPLIRHMSASDSQRHQEVLAKPVLLNSSDAPHFGARDSPRHPLQLNHYTSVPDLGPHEQIPTYHKPRIRHGTSTGIPPRFIDPHAAAAHKRIARSTDSLPRVISKPSDPTQLNLRTVSPIPQQPAPRHRDTGAGESSSGSETSGMEMEIPFVRPINGPLDSIPSSSSVTTASTSVLGTESSRLTVRNPPQDITIPAIELLHSTDGGRSTVPMKPEITVNGANLTQREVTPIKLRAPREVLNKLTSRYEPGTNRSVGSSSSREVILNRSSEESTLDGFSIRGGRGNGVFVSSTPAWMSEDGLVVGDRIVYIGGENVENATFEHCHFLIQCSLVYGSSLAFIVDHDLPGLRKLAEGARDNFYVRCEFNYARMEEGELEISRGDILHVVDTMHEDRTDSWFAYKMKGAQRTTVAGIVPSKNRASALTIRRRSSQVSRDLDMDDPHPPLQQRGASPKPAVRRGSLKTNFKLKNLFLKRIPSGEDQLAVPLPSTAPMTMRDNIPKGYSNVQLVSFKRPRPVLLLGVCVEFFVNQLLQNYPQVFFRANPELFSSGFAVKAGLENRSILKCSPPLEDTAASSNCSSSMSAGYQCLTMQSITGDDRRHCILEFQAGYIDLLEQCDLHPIVLFLQPKSERKLRLLAMQTMGNDTSTVVSREMFETATDDLAKWRCKLTGVIDVGTGIDRTQQKVVNRVQGCQRGQNWIPVRSAM
ncbi:uncharacterized protein LOC135806300 [Sycon ciliatum]|uniref:uncharacterized protein LOC135806300 n=1 Tax=Sycon ciliatum TaxID=27933 RepID=UPI0031F6BD70